MTASMPLVAAMRPVLNQAPSGPVGVAVSGGGDSVALLILMQTWAGGAGRSIAAVTVDHGLRPESAVEAAAVSALCARRGVPHVVRAWDGWDEQGNLQAAARAARRLLIADWAREAGIGAVALGHTRDDQAETFLMRLARGSGVDGLSAMAPVQASEGLVWLRPMLGVGRDELRECLREAGVAWVEDPGNADRRFDRVRARAALEPLAEIGLGPRRLAETAARLGRVRAALEAAALEAARGCLAPTAFGELRLDPGQLAAMPAEIRLRVLAGALCWVSGAVYRPRLAALENLAATIEAGRIGHGATLHGAVLRARRDGILIRRERARVAGPVAPDRVWDGRWRLDRPPEGSGLMLGAVGRGGLAQCPGWRSSGAGQEGAATTPGLWRGRDLVAAPLLGLRTPLQVHHVAPVFDPWPATLLR